MLGFDLAYELALGTAAALLTRRSNPMAVLRDGWRASLCVYVPFAAVSAVVWSDWQAMYLANVGSSKLSIAVFTVGSCAALLSTYLVGFVIGLSARRARLGGWVVALAIGLIALSLVTPGKRRALCVTSYAEFRAGYCRKVAWGGRRALLGRPISAFLIVSALCNGAAFVWLVRRARSTA
jgi:hypothetical protein